MNYRLDLLHIVSVYVVVKYYLLQHCVEDQKIKTIF